MEVDHRKLQVELDTAYIFKKHVNEIGQNLESYQEKLQNERKKIEEEVRSYFNRIRDNITSVEHSILENIASLEFREQTKTSEEVERLMRIKQEIKRILSEGNNIVEESSDAEKLASFTSTTKIYIRSIEEKLNILEDRTREIKLFLKCNQELFDMFSNHDMFCSLSAKRPQRRIHWDESSTKKFDLIEELECSGVNPSLDFIPGTDRDIIVASWDPHTLRNLGQNGTIQHEITLPGHPEEMCTFSEKVALTLPLIRKINIYNISDLSEVASLQVSGGCSGICRLKNNFIVSFPDESVIKVISDGGKVVNCSDRVFKFPTFVCAVPPVSAVFVADGVVNTVEAVSYDLQSKLFVISHAELQDPGRMCFNGHHNEHVDDRRDDETAKPSVFICSREKHCVLKFGSDGKYLGKVLSEQDGLHRPRTLCYNPRDKIFTVGGSDGGIQMFQQSG